MRLPSPPEVGPIRDFQTAMRSIIDRRYASSTRHRFERASVDWSGVHPILRLFAVKLESRMRKRFGVPLRCVGTEDSELVRIVHARQGEKLHRMAWELIGHAGNEMSVQYSFGVRWVGVDEPAMWQLHPDLVPPFRWKELKALGLGRWVDEGGEVLA